MAPDGDKMAQVSPKTAHDDEPKPRRSQGGVKMTQDSRLTAQEGAKMILLGPLGTLLGPPWGHLGATWGPPWVHPGGSWVYLGPPGGLLGLYWVIVVLT